MTTGTKMLLALLGQKTVVCLPSRKVLEQSDNGRFELTEDAKASVRKSVCYATRIILSEFRRVRDEIQRKFAVII